MNIELDDDNLLNYAMKHYDNPECKSIEEFQEDLTRTIYIKRLFRKYKSSGELKERLILNHIIIFYNVFGIEASTNILFFKIEDEFWPLLKTFLVYLDMFPENDIQKIKIPLDNTVIEILRKI
ncbi:MAG: hypothetical protein H8D80_01295 [Proteobacteria bacterium]|nr:hypothetical protein [Pseudomonadota bacterium]